MLASAFSVCLPTLASAADVVLGWDPNQETDLAGYKVYYGTSSRNYSTVISIGKVTTATVPNLGSGTWFFAVTAFNSAGLESGFSNEVSASISVPSTPPCDVNGDGGINVADLQSLANVILGLQACPRACDTNKDSRVDALDLQVLSNVILGLGVCP